MESIKLPSIELDQLRKQETFLCSEEFSRSETRSFLIFNQTNLKIFKTNKKEREIEIFIKSLPWINYV